MRFASADIWLGVVLNGCCGTLAGSVASSRYFLRTATNSNALQYPLVQLSTSSGFDISDVICLASAAVNLILSIVEYRVERVAVAKSKASPEDCVQQTGQA